MWRQKKIISRFLNACNLVEKDHILDIPCGSGYIAPVLFNNKASVTASDISLEMMNLAKEEYSKDKFLGFVQSDITKTPFYSNFFSCVIILSLMHRLPKPIRQEALMEIARLSKKYLIITYSEENILLKLKQLILKSIKPSHLEAPSSIPLKVMVNEMRSAGIEIIKKERVVFFFSSMIVFLAQTEK